MRDEWKRSANGIWTGMLAAAQVAPPDGRISPKTNRVDRNGYESSIRPKSTARNASFPLAICNHYSLITALFFGFIFGLSLRASSNCFSTKAKQKRSAFALLFYLHFSPCECRSGGFHVAIVTCCVIYPCTPVLVSVGARGDINISVTRFRYVIARKTYFFFHFDDRQKRLKCFRCLIGISFSNRAATITPRHIHVLCWCNCAHNCDGNNDVWVSRFLAISTRSFNHAD